jgi:hypothetical protein
MQTQHTFFKSISPTELINGCIFDVSLHSDCSQNVRELPQVACNNIVFPKKIISSVSAQYLFPCQTRATARSEFYKEKSSVLHEDSPARPNEVQEWAQVAHWKCVSDTLWVSGNAYQRSGYIVTPRERCMLQQVYL